MIFSNVTTPKNVRSFGSAQNEPKIIFKYKSLVTMKLIVDKIDKEVGWLGIVEKLGERTYVVGDIHVPKQEANSGTCEITPEGLNELVAALPADQTDKVRLWGHSHGSGGVFASGQDETQAMEMLNNCQDYVIRVICNKAHVMSVSFFDYVEKKVYENIQWYYDDGLDHKKLNEEVDTIVKANVKDFTYTPPSSVHSSEHHRYDPEYGDYGYVREGQWPLLNRQTEREFDRDVQKELAKTNLNEEFKHRSKHYKAGKANFSLAR